MTGELFYFRFMFVGAIGVVGVGMVLVRLLETLLNEWDVWSDVKDVVARRNLHHPRVDLNFDEPAEKAPVRLATRLYRHQDAEAAPPAREDRVPALDAGAPPAEALPAPA